MLSSSVLLPHFYDCNHIFEAQKHDSNNKTGVSYPISNWVFNFAHPQL